MAPNVYVQLNAAVDQALPYEGMTAEVEYVKCRDHLPRRRKESVVTAAQPKRRVTPQPSQATSKGANPEARKQWREAIAQAIVGLIINLDAIKILSDSFESANFERNDCSCYRLTQTQ